MHYAFASIFVPCTMHNQGNRAERLEVIDEANDVLQGFKNFMSETYPKACSLYEDSKWLWQEVHDLHSKHGDQSEVVALFEKQTEKWDVLKTSAAELRELIQGEFAKVKSVEDRVKKARGTGPNVAAFGFPTQAQKVARVVYAKKLKYSFQDARDEVAMMCNFPDGMLVQIRSLHKYAEKMAAPEHHEPEVRHPPVPDHLSVTDEADKVLQNFKEVMKATYPKASALYERAKWMWQDVHDKRAQKAPDMEVVAMLERQAETWDKLLKDSETLGVEINKEMAKVNDAEDRVKKARGVYPNVAALGFPTPEQRLARQLYAKKFKYAFHDANDEYAALCGFPEGLLNKIHQVRDFTLKTAGTAGEVVDAPKSSE
mmetsp:Transcript_22847/g.43467  ORF Transcript_22847/g.43467 Transcript_22847/m.43467 type:complete len:371 (+) Transcript_22847:424-1536(+)